MCFAVFTRRLHPSHSRNHNKLMGAFRSVNRNFSYVCAASSPSNRLNHQPWWLRHVSIAWNMQSIWFVYVRCFFRTVLGWKSEPYKVWQFTHESSLHHRLSALLTNIINCMSCKFILHVSISTIYQPDYRFRHHASYIRHNESNSRREIMLKP